LSSLRSNHLERRSELPEHSEPLLTQKERRAFHPPAYSGILGKSPFLREGACKRNAQPAGTSKQREYDLITVPGRLCPHLLLFASSTPVNLEALDSGEWAASQLTYPCRPHRGPAPTFTGTHTNSKQPHHMPKPLPNGDSGPVTGQWSDTPFQALQRRSGVIEASGLFQLYGSSSTGRREHQVAMSAATKRAIGGTKTVPLSQ
jgi:hypothetical protein